MALAGLAVDRMAARIAGRTVEDREIVLEPELTIRSSTTAPRTMS